MADDAPAQHRKQRGRPFLPGDPRRCNGRKPGTRNRVSILAEKLMTDDAEAVVRAIITAAKCGDMAAAKMILERIAALPKDRPVTFDVPSILTAADVSGAMQKLLEEVGAGRLTPSEGAQVAALLETRRRTIETEELAALLKGFEQQRR